MPASRCCSVPVAGLASIDRACLLESPCLETSLMGWADGQGLADPLNLLGRWLSGSAPGRIPSQPLAGLGWVCEKSGIDAADDRADQPRTPWGYACVSQGIQFRGDGNIGIGPVLQVEPT